MHRITEFFVGLLFGLGLLLSGMTDPAKVLGFLDLFGIWDPSLAFVMGGAIAVGFFAFALARKRTTNFMADHPQRSVILEQVYAGICVRMAILYLLLGGADNGLAS